MAFQAPPRDTCVQALYRSTFVSIRLPYSLIDRVSAVISAVSDNRRSPSHHSALRRIGFFALLLATLPLCMQAATTPAITTPARGAVLPGPSATFTWTTETGVASWQLWLGTTGVGSGNLGVYSRGSTSATSLSVTATGLPTPGSTVYARLFYDLNGNWVATDYTYKEASASAPAVSALACTTTSFTGAATDACTVTLAAAAPSGGATVALTSSNTAVAVPATVSVAAAATSASFTATVSAVTTAQTANVTASAGGASKSCALSLNTAAPALTLSASSIGFGTVTLNSPTTKTVTLTSSGKGSLTISALALTGAGFAESGVAAPVTLTPGQTATLTVQFDPTAAGAATGQITVTTNAGAAQTISLSGTGQASSTPAITSPAPGNVLPGSSATFTWSTGSGVSTWQLWLGTTGVGSGNLGVYSMRGTTASSLSASVTGLPTTGGTVYVRLFYVLNGNWIASDYIYTASSAAAALSSISCSSSALSGATSDACTVTLTSASATTFTVALTSSNTAVTVPASVTVSAGATSGTFTASAAAVTTTQTATLTASAAGVSKTAALQLTPSTAALTVSTAFGTVQTNTPTTQGVTLTSSGTASVTINSIALTGTGFTISGVSAGLVLTPGQTATLNVQFDPTTASSFSGGITITSNATSGATQTIALTGTGNSTTYGVQLSWDAPTGSTDPVVGYNIYRAASGSTTYQMLNSSTNASTNFADNTVQCAKDYTYIVTSVDSSGSESLPSNSIDLTIP